MNLVKLQELRVLLLEYIKFLGVNQDRASMIGVTIESVDAAIKLDPGLTVKVEPRKSTPTRTSGTVSSLVLPEIKTPMSVKDILTLIVIRLGNDWRYADITSAKLSQWLRRYKKGHCSTREAKGQLDRLVRNRYAAQNGREDRGRRVEPYGTTCVTYGLVSTRVAKLLGLSKKKLRKKALRLKT